MKYSLFHFVYSWFALSNVIGEEIATLNPISQNRSTTIQVLLIPPKEFSFCAIFSTISYFHYVVLLHCNVFIDLGTC